MKTNHKLRGEVSASGIGVLIILVLAIIGLMSWGIPQYNLYSRSMHGQAILKQQEYEKKVKIEEAEADYEAAKFYAKAEVERAKGTKEANDIVQSSFGGPTGYLHYLYIQALMDIDDKGGQVIYVPTEAGLPILEARDNPPGGGR